MSEVINRGSCPPVDQDYCDATPLGSLWPVCSRPVHESDSEHESADFRWREGEDVPRLKALFPSLISEGRCPARSAPAPRTGGTIKATKAEMAARTQAALDELAAARELLATIARAMDMPLAAYPEEHRELTAVRGRMQAVQVWVDGLRLGDELPPVISDYRRVTNLLTDEMERPLRYAPMAVEQIATGELAR